MAHPNHRRAADLFKAALDLDPAARLAFLDAQCAGDISLRCDVDSLLAADLRADDFLFAPPERVRSLATQSDVLLDQQFDGYRIVRRIAVGGMGAVYEAVHERLGRTVALKVIRSGSTTESALRRFEYEAKFLARLRHVGIAQIYDVGAHTVGGVNLPYFAMEYVTNARTLVEYANEHGLSTRRRLELFIQACDAVQYAHQVGVIHRDLKPNNILVSSDSPSQRDGSTTQPTAKVIDFGVARLIESDRALTSMHTAYGQLLGTLQYMSPEQCGLDPEAIDTRSDIYSLGVVLYELVAGQLPYDVQRLSLIEATRVIQQEPPPRLSALNRDLRGELDTIIQKAIEKDRERRYRTAAELSDDIRRYLKDEPISARPPSMTYQLRAFARRNRAMVAGILAVLFVLIAGIVTTSWQAARARKSERITRESLRGLYVAQARSIRRTQSAGQRTAAIEALSKAAAIRPAQDLRDEVMTTLSFPDIRESIYPLPANAASSVLSHDLSHYAALLPDGGIQIVRLGDGRERGRIPPPSNPNASVIKLWCGDQSVIRLFDRKTQSRRLEVWRIQDAALILQISDVPDRASFDVAKGEETLAVGHGDRAIHLYNLSTGQETRRIELDRDPSYLQFNPDGSRLARFHARDAQASVLDLETLKSSRIFEGSNINFALAWSPDGKFIAGSDEYLIRIWDVARQREIAVLPGHESGVVHLAFSNDGRFLASYGWDGKSIIWDLTTMQSVLHLKIQSPTFSSDDRTIAGVLMNEGKLAISVQDFLKDDYGSFIGGDLGAEAATATTGAVDPTGNIAVSGYASRIDESLGMQFYDIRRRTCIGRLPCGRVDSLRFHPSATSLFTTGDTGLLRWPLELDPTTVRIGPPEVLIPDSQTEQFDVSADGRRIAAVSWGKQELTVLNLDSPQSATSYKTLPDARSVAISPDGKWAVVTTWHGDGCEVWDIDSGIVIARPAITGSALPAFSPDGKWLVIRDWKGISVLRPITWDVVHWIDMAWFSRFGFSCDSRTLIASDDKSAINLIDLSSGRIMTSFCNPDQIALTDPSITTDGLLVAFAQRGALLQIWDLAAMRKTLASMQLDWDHAAYPALEASSRKAVLKLVASVGDNSISTKQSEFTIIPNGPFHVGHPPAPMTAQPMSNRVLNPNM